MHFNRSIQQLSIVVEERRGELSYMDKEMLLMTNILYYGIVTMLNDVTQVILLHKSFLSLLEKIRFGEDDPSQCRGIMGYNELLALVLCLDGNKGNEELPPRSKREWVVGVPCYESFRSTSEAYIAFLPLVHWYLQSDDGIKLPRDTTNKAAAATRLAQLSRFEKGLGELLSTLSPPTPGDRAAITYMHYYVQVRKIHEQCALARNCLQIMKEEEKLIPILGYLERILGQTNSCSQDHNSLLMRYSHYSGYLLERIVGRTHNVEIRRRALRMMREWPYLELHAYSINTAVIYGAIIDYELAGPRRTGTSQLSGNPMSSDYENSSLLERVFDGTCECGCIYGLYICRDHKIGGMRVQMKTTPRYFSLASRYEARHNLEYTRFYLNRNALPREDQPRGNKHEDEYQVWDFIG